ncbi:MAG: tRNA threonylcarbamoyladenosine dehydratase [Tannerella sp.]|jgi:tRNA A37 threonylcarbamoyladenosine dehydratase|nr:tRNA threonylcarbamoyladenosine dehydratase [Tannerella sp.]
MNKDNKFSRTTLLVGDGAQKKIAAARIILFGAGGVGSWCAESLIRSGTGHLTIVDSDVVDVSNINRQLPASTQTIGLPKVDVLKKRLLEINPDADIHTRQQFYDTGSSKSFDLHTYDYIIDAIDSLDSKLHLICNATQTNAVFFSSMGAALKMNPLQIQAAEFWNVYGCPLAAALRRKMKREKLYPAKKFRCVFSDELLENKVSGDDLTIKMNSRITKRVNGTIVHVTAIFGFTLAGLVMQDLCST